MNVDFAIQEAIQQSVRQLQQPDTVSEKLIKWLDEVISGNENIDNEESVYRRLDNLCTAIEAEALQTFLALGDSLRLGNLSTPVVAEAEDEA
jgi:hypothetical protein